MTDDGFGHCGHIEPSHPGQCDQRIFWDGASHSWLHVARPFDRKHKAVFGRSVGEPDGKIRRRRDVPERASDLPVGSIVANDHTAWIKVSKADDDLGCWSATNDELATSDSEPQEALNSGAVVVRHGLSVAKPPADTSWIRMTEIKER